MARANQSRRVPGSFFFIIVLGGGLSNIRLAAPPPFPVQAATKRRSLISEGELLCGNLEGVGRQNAREPHTHKTCLEGGYPRTSEESPDERGGLRGGEALWLSAASFSPALSSSVDPPSRLLARLSCRLIFRVALVSPAAGDSARLGSTRLDSARKRKRKEAAEEEGGPASQRSTRRHRRPRLRTLAGTFAPPHWWREGGSVAWTRREARSPPPRLPQTPPTLPVTRRSMRWGRTREDEDIGLT